MKLPKGKDRVLVACRNFLFNNMPSEVSISKEQIYNMLSSGRVVCLFDNVNISNTDHLVWIQAFIKEFSNNRFIITAEEKFYQTYTIKELPDFGIAYRSVHIECFGKRQVREMVTKWGCGKEGFDANEMTQKIVAYCNNVRFAMTPFNIAVFMTIWDTDRNFVPINEGKVMRTYLETVLDKFSTEEFQRSAYDCNLKQNFLGYLAYKMCLKDEYFFTCDEFDEQVKEYHDKKGYTKSKTHFDTLFFEKNILCINGDCIFFSNTSIMEYCLAFYATTEPALYSLMTQKGNRTRFTHELMFYSGIVQDCTKLLNDLNDEITSTILENMDMLDEVEKLSISAEFSINKKRFAEMLASNRCTMEEVDELDEGTFAGKETSPMEITKINSIEDSESFFELLLIYGNVIKNAETIDKPQKKLHLENYVLGMNFQFGLLVKEFSSFLTSKSKEDLPDEIKEQYPDITDEEFDRMKDRVLDLLKIILPIAIQFNMADNVGTPKLEVVITELIRENVDKKFTRFMLSLLLCDIGNEDMKRFLAEYIKEEDSKDILKLIMVKLGIYYSMWYFGRNPQMDNILLELITEIQLKLNGEKEIQMQSQKGTVMKQIKQQYDAKRGRLV